MFSSSSAYLGGGNTARPGQQPPFAQQQNMYAQQAPPQQQAFAQQPAFLPGQPTGYGVPVQTQMTGYPQQQPVAPQPVPQPGVPGQQFQQYAQPTGQFQHMQQQPQQQQVQMQMQQQPVQPAVMQQPTLQAPPQPSASAAPKQAPQQTGLTSSQMADSFRGSARQPSAPKRSSAASKIPSIRLSFITASDQAKFEQLFKSAVGNNQAMSGDQAKELLLRSKLSGEALAHIWMLCDTTKSGQLLFPEFALAMYLCNLKLNGKDIPASLPDKVRNEVSSMVDIISFGVPDDKPLPSAPAFFDSRQSATAPPVIQQPQPQPSNASLLAGLASQTTGAMPGNLGYGGQMGVQPTGVMQQAYTGQVPNQYGVPIPPVPQIPTAYGSSLSPMAAAPLSSMPTGVPGQWGLVNTPASGLPNIEALHRQMMPQAGREGGFTTAGLSGNATIPWAVTKDEKRIYDDIFRSWDGLGKGFVSGDQAIEIFQQSGVDRKDLERIWTLSDPSNKGRLDLDEFSVAMHLIYRKLNGYPVPNRLPPELTPPSTRNLNDSIGTVKSMLQRDAEQRKTSGAFLQPQATGVSYLKSRSFRQGSPIGGADGTVYKNNDDNIGYRSSARHRLGADGRTPSPKAPTSPSSEKSDLTSDQIRKLIKEKQIILDAIDFRDENEAEEDEALDRRNRGDADELYRRIRRIQEDIDSHPNASKVVNAGSDAERRALTRQLQGLSDKLPQLASQVRRCERAIADAQHELFRLRDAKAHPGAASVIGTGPGGSVTESDRLKAKAKALMQQRSAALTGKPLIATGDDPAAAAQRQEAESSRIREECERNERMVQDVEESVSTFSKALESSLKENAPSSSADHERRRWEEALGVEDEVRDFIYELQRQSERARAKQTDSAPRESYKAPASSTFDRGAPSAPAKPSTPSSQAGGSSYGSYRTAEERSAYIKQQAELKMAERLAALGIKPSKPGETAQQRAERQRKEEEERLRKAEEEDAQREQERQRKLDDEQITPPVGKPAKKPPPPPSRKTTSTMPQAAETKPAEQQLRAEQEAQELEKRRLEEEGRLQENELAKEKEAAEARLRELEAQVKQGKLRKEEEKKRRQAEQKAAKERDDRLAAQRAEIDAARERARQLQLQVEGLGDDDSSDDEGPAKITPQATPTTSQELPPVSAPTVPAAQALPKTITAPQAVSTPGSDVETKNPFLKKIQASAAASSDTSSTSIPPVPGPINPAPAESTNPFYRLTQQDAAKATAATIPAVPAVTRTSRARNDDDDDWDRVTDSSDDEDDDGPVGGAGAKQLASLLFGTMAPPPARPLSATESAGRTPTSPPPAGSAAAASTPSSPPPAPPLPSSNAPPPPPMPASMAPPPPPLPGSGGAPPPPPMPAAKAPAGGAGRDALLGAIQAGARLRKVETKDRSTSAVAGKVL